MTQEELIADCRYYKGEEENTFQDKYKKSFCAYEKCFVKLCLREEDFLKVWLEYSQKYIRYAEKNKIDNIFSDKKVKPVTKAIVAYIQSMMEKWCPLDVDDIFRY